MKSKIVIVDNFDSFTYNLKYLLEKQSDSIEIYRNNAPLSVLTAAAEQATHLVISPGPGKPRDAGNAPELLANAARELPILGVCLGHQMIVEYFGGVVGKAEHVMHGKTDQIRHNRSALFRGLPNPFNAARYHSLLATKIGPELEVTATTGSGEVMAVKHHELPILGLQFHPESLMTLSGERLIRNFLKHQRS